MTEPVTLTAHHGAQFAEWSAPTERSEVHFVWAYHSLDPHALHLTITDPKQPGISHTWVMAYDLIAQILCHRTDSANLIGQGDVAGKCSATGVNMLLRLRDPNGTDGLFGFAPTALRALFVPAQARRISIDLPAYEQATAKEIEELFQ